jgi:hypothetical protein
LRSGFFTYACCILQGGLRGREGRGGEEREGASVRQRDEGERAVSDV